MSDGFATPAIHDGMSAFKGPDGTIRLIRNHEIRNAAGNFAFGVAGPASTRYDALAGGVLQMAKIRGINGYDTHINQTVGAELHVEWVTIDNPDPDPVTAANSSVLDSPDNRCVTPSGGILFCEDDASGASDTHPLAPGITDINRLVGMGGGGEPFEFAVNIFSDGEFAGACFSPDGEILFVNIQGGNSTGSGMTLAITGPWRRGPL